MGHVKSNIGGIYENDKTYDQAGAVYTHVPKAKQKEAMQFIIAQALKTPTWMLNNESLSKFDDALILSRIGRMQTTTLNSILEFSRLARVIDNSAKNGKNAYAIDELFSDLQTGIFTELTSATNIDVYRRNLQRAYIDRLQYLLTQTQTSPTEPTKINVEQSDIRPIARMGLVNLQSAIRKALPRYSNIIIKAHLTDALARIDLILNPKG
jgi:hypothetical protein